MPKWQKWVSDDYEDLDEYESVEKIRKKKKSLVEPEYRYEKKENPSNRQGEKKY